MLCLLHSIINKEKYKKYIYSESSHYGNIVKNMTPEGSHIGAIDTWIKFL